MNEAVNKEREKIWKKGAVFVEGEKRIAIREVIKEEGTDGGRGGDKLQQEDQTTVSQERRKMQMKGWRWTEKTMRVQARKDCGQSDQTKLTTRVEGRRNESRVT